MEESGNNNEKNGIELNEENKNIFKESIDFNKFTEEFILFYQNKVQEKINPILENKAIEYLDLQVKMELDGKMSIMEENKSDKAIFMEHIKEFLNNYFFYISQKYYVYHFIFDSFEPFSDEIEKQIDNIMNSFFSSDKARLIYKNNYIKKFENFEGIIDSKRNNGLIYG